MTDADFHPSGRTERRQAEGFTRGNPQAIMVGMPIADRFFFRSAAVLRNALDEFIGALPQ